MKSFLSFFLIVITFSSFTHRDLNEYGKWLKFYNLEDNDFLQNGASKKIIADWKPHDLSADDKKLYDSLFFYSSDSSCFLDLYSYSVIITKDKNGKVTWGGGDPESKVELVTTKGDLATMLFYFGTDEYAESAVWRNEFLFDIFGFTIQNGTYVPTLWKCDKSNMCYKAYYNKKAFKTRPASYLTDVRLKSIPMKK